MTVKIEAPVEIQEAKLKAVVTRCGCDDPMSHAKDNLPCPRPRQVENLGLVSYWHRNPLMMLGWKIKQSITGAKGSFHIKEQLNGRKSTK